MDKIIFILALIFCSGSYGCIQSISVLDNEFKKVSEVDSVNDISVLNEIWKKKTVSEEKIRINWSNGYKLDVIGDKCGGRWLYHHGGWLMPLMKKGSGLYKINEFERFESVLSITTHNKKIKATRVNARRFI